MRVAAWALVAAAATAAPNGDGVEYDPAAAPMTPQSFNEDDENDLLSSPASVPMVEPDYKTQPAKPTEISDASSVFLLETFQNGDLSESGWTQLDATSAQKEKFQGVWEIVDDNPQWTQGERVLKMSSASAYHGLAKTLSHEFNPKVQSDLFGTMEVKFDQSHVCGGAYFKLFHTNRLTDSNSVSSFTDATPYSIMFGPDRCGYGTNKVHLIIKFPHPSNNSEEGEDDYVEEHLKNPPTVKTTSPADGPTVTQQYGFALHSDGTYEIFQSGEKLASGNLKNDFSTGFAAPETIQDPHDTKPKDWIDEASIDDPEAVKPDDWDEDAPEMIEDPSAVKPAEWLDDAPLKIPNPDAFRPKDWNDEEDGVWTAPLMPNPDCYVGCGEWKPPLINNPDFKGKWTPPQIDNPEYQGEWKPRQISNPKFFDIENPWEIIQPANALGFELWTVESGTTFDNIFLTTDRAAFDSFLKQTYGYKRALEDENVALYEASKKKAAESHKTKPLTGAGSPAAGLTGAVLQGYDRLTKIFKHYAEGKPTSMLMVSFGIPLMFVAMGLTKVIRRGATHAVTSSTGGGVSTSPKKSDPVSRKTRSSKTTDDAVAAEPGDDKENTDQEQSSSVGASAAQSVEKMEDPSQQEEEEVAAKDGDNLTSSTVRKRRGSSGTRRAAASQN